MSTPAPLPSPLPAPAPVTGQAVEENIPELKKKLMAAKDELRESLKRKRKMDEALAAQEHHIYVYEGQYLEDNLHPPPSGNASAQAFGNIVKGYEGYVKVPATGGHGTGYDRKKKAHGGNKEVVPDSDRLWSNSSRTHRLSLALHTLANPEKPPANVVVPNISSHNSGSVEPEDEDEREESRPNKKKKRNH